MRRALLITLIALPACDRVFGLDRDPLPPDAAEPPDAPGPDARVCYGTGSLTLCLMASPGPRLDVDPGTTTVIDTDMTGRCAPYTGGEPDLCVIAVDELVVEGRMRATGSRPLVIVTPGAVSIGAAGLIDLIGIGSAGAQPPECIDGTDAMNSAGGAGGSFGGRGGNGGSGNMGFGGAASSPVTPTRLRGGCKGKTGGNTVVGGSGRGGGALAILAGGTITIDGAINASGDHGGGGGGGQTPGRGGSGGGSGGMIVLDAPLLALSPLGQILANGGGGGEGGGNPAPGRDGADPTQWNVAAAGGAGSSAGGDGGDGSVGATPGAMGGAGVTGTNPTGGGGGGGGAGVIRLVNVAGPPTQLSPPPS